jgi:hypothetical protein
MVVYLGTEGLEGYLKTAVGEIMPGDPDALHHAKNCLLVTFEDKRYLSKDDLAVIKQLGLRFSGENGWTQFQSYQAGYLPWQLTRDEAVYLTLCLQQAKEVTLRFKDSPDMLEPPRPDYYFTRVSKKEKGALKWQDAWLMPHPLREVVIMHKTIDVGRLEKIRQLDRQGKMIWEIDFFYAPAYVAEKGKRPYYPMLFLCIEQHSYFILSTHLTTPQKYRVEFIEFCLQAFEAAKFLPQEIQVRKEELFAYLEPLAKQLEVRIRLVKKLNAIDDARQSMEKAFQQPFSRNGPKVGRNEPCPCGSGKKYKKCCGLEKSI